MYYEQLLKGCGEVGCRLLSAGAEIYRVEDTVRRMLGAYGVKAEVFAIPTVLMVSITDDKGHTHTSLYRPAAAGGTDIEAVERFNAMSRAVCADPPPPERLLPMAEETAAGCRSYTWGQRLVGYFFGALLFTFFFRGGIPEGLAAGIAAVLCGICVMAMDRLRVNFFFKTVAAALVLGLVVYGLAALGMPINTDSAVSGALMVLVPGLIFTNFMCDLMTGDSLSGVSTFIRAILTAAAIALGSGGALAIYEAFGLGGLGTDWAGTYSPLIQCVIAFFACAAFCTLYNIHGHGVALCCLGAVLGWAVNLLMCSVSDNMYLCYAVAAMVISVYAETMARLRKFPITAYLVVSYFPLVPGTYIYFAMYYGIHGDWAMALDKGVQAFGLAASLAIGVLLVSTVVRTWNNWKRERREKHGPV